MDRTDKHSDLAARSTPCVSVKLDLVGLEQHVSSAVLHLRNTSQSQSKKQTSMRSSGLKNFAESRDIKPQNSPVLLFPKVSHSSLLSSIQPSPEYITLLS